MKGKEAAAAASQRAKQAQAEVDRLTLLLKSERNAYEQQIHDLQTQVRSERSNHMGEASRLANEEVQRRLAEVEKERADRGMSETMMLSMLYRNDRFIMNACRYISMTNGYPPSEALTMVLAWKTDKDVTTMPSLNRLIELGIPGDGWVAREISTGKYWNKSKYAMGSAISLDKAEEQGHSKIHPDYKPFWYPKNIEYKGLELVESRKEDG